MEFSSDVIEGVTQMALRTEDVDLTPADCKPFEVGGLVFC